MEKSTQRLQRQMNLTYQDLCNQQARFNLLQKEQIRQLEAEAWADDYLN